MTPSGRLVRSDTDRIIGGVAGGIANYLNVDPALVRLAFVLFVWLGGVSPFIYLILWAVIPSESSVGQSFGQQVRSNISDMEQRATQVAGTVSKQVNRMVGSSAEQPADSGQQSPGDGPATGPTRRL